MKANAEYFDRITSEYKEEVIYAEVYLVKEYEQGSVYRLAIEPIVGLEYERLNQYFYVTEDKIYRLWPSYYSEDRQEVIHFYDDALFTAFLNTDEKLIEEGKIVCQSEELESSQEEKEERICYSISKNNNQVTYSYQELKINGETNYSENYVWEEGKGLTMYTSGCGGALKDILYMTEITVASGTGNLYTWEGEELVPMGMFYDKEATLSDFAIQEEETDFGEERIDIIDGTMDAVMEILLQAGNENIKLIYDGIDRFAGREYLVVSSYEENDVKIHRTASYYIDRNSGNIYRKEENNDSLRDELHYIGLIK